MCAILITLMTPAAAIWAEEPANQSLRPLRLMDAKKEKRLRALLPKVASTEIRALLDDPRLLLYTENEMPPAYQDWEGGLNGIHSPSYNVSADRRERHGNGNREFPWGSPAGAHRCKNVSSFRFLRLPRDEGGKTLPVVWRRERARGDVRDGYAWMFPVGTVFGEVLVMRSPSGRDLAFELRIRERALEQWNVDAFRPFPTAEDLAKAIKWRRPDWRDSPEHAELVTHLSEPQKLEIGTLRSRHPRRTVIEQSMGVDVLPGLRDEELIVALLTQTEFKSALGSTWRKGINEVFTCAPTTESEFHIVPREYDAGFIEVNRESCMRCHETANTRVREFHFLRDWYGRIRGSDGIFSFHPFALSSIARNGFGRRVSMRKEFVDAGILELYDPQTKHPRSTYRAIPNLK